MAITNCPHFDSVKDEAINDYASVVINGNFFIIDGRPSRYISDTGIIVRLDATTWSWSRRGFLKKRRRNFGVILMDSKLVVVGQQVSRNIRSYTELYDSWSEFCEWKNGNFTCIEQNSSLEGLESVPLLFAVSDDYKNC